MYPSGLATSIKIYSHFIYVPFCAFDSWGLFLTAIPSAFKCYLYIFRRICYQKWDYCIIKSTALLNRIFQYNRSNHISEPLQEADTSFIYAFMSYGCGSCISDNVLILRNVQGIELFSFFCMFNDVIPWGKIFQLFLHLRWKRILRILKRIYDAIKNSEQCQKQAT